MLLQGLGPSDLLSLLSNTADTDGDVANRASLSQATVTDLHHEALEEVLESHHSQNGLHQRCQPTQLGPASQDKLTIGWICVLEGYR